jgi:hypothetical protein
VSYRHLLDRSTGAGRQYPAFVDPELRVDRVRVAPRPPIRWIVGQDDRPALICDSCTNIWIHAPAVVVPSAHRAGPERRPLTRTEALARFPTADDLTDEARARAVELKDRFLRKHPTRDPRVPDYFRRYQQIFSAEGLPHARPQDLKDFANNTIGANPGNMSVFNTAWNRLGDQVAAARVRRAVDYLLRGADERDIEDRMQILIVTDDPGITGFRESLLTRVLCVVEPARFLPILIYTSSNWGKKEIAAAVFDIEPPSQKSTSMATGRLAFLEQRPAVEAVRTRIRRRRSRRGVPVVGEG